MNQIEPSPQKKNKNLNLITSTAFLVSVAVHGVLFMMVGTVIIFEGKVPTDLFSGYTDAGDVGAPSEAEMPPVLMEEEIPEMLTETANELVPEEVFNESMALDTMDLITVQTPVIAPSFTLPVMEGNAVDGVSKSVNLSLGNQENRSGKLSPGRAGGTLTKFGFIGGDSSQGLAGTFYDYKKDQSGKPAKGKLPTYPEIIAGFIRNGAWGPSKKYEPYQSKETLYLTSLIFPGVKDVEAGAAFQEPKTKPGLWLAHYSGQVIAEKSGSYRLVGWGDNFLYVGIDGKVVLDASDHNVIKRVERKAGGNIDVPGKRDARLILGEGFKLRQGQTYQIDILMGDSGGIFSAGAAVMEEDETYDRSKVLKEYPMLIFSDLSKEEKKMYSFCSKKTLIKTIFQVR